MSVWLILNWKWITSGLVAGITAAFLTSMSYRITIANMEKDKANDDLVAANLALIQYHQDAETIHGAAVAFDNVQFSLNTALGTISKDFNSAIKARPLPADCKPDAVRLRSLANAIAATNTAAGLQPVPAVPAHP